MESAAQRIMSLFAGFEGTHGTHGTPYLDDNGLKWAIKKTARTIKQRVSMDLWKQHLEGKRPLGIIPIREDSMCGWGSIDIDQYDINILDVVKRVEAAKLPLVPCRSKSGGLHLFMFMKEPVEAEKVQSTLRDIAASLGFAGCEIFPKQTKILVEQGDQGNWMVMPYFGDDYGGKIKFQYGLKKTGAEMTLDEFLSFSEKRKLTEDDLEQLKLARQAHAKASGKKGKGKAGGAEPKVPFGNGPPCLQHMAEGGFPADGRKRAMFHIGIFLKRAHPDEWQERLEQDNQRFFKPPLPTEEVQSVIKSLEKKDYEYTCKEQPMASHCNSVMCRSRKFGVGAGGEYPVIESISKLDTDPPLWFVQIPGGSRMSLLTEELTNYRKFLNACVAYSKPPVCFKLLRDDVWVGILSELIQRADIIEASPEVGKSGIFIELLETFLTNRTRGTKKEDLLRGAPWEDEEAGRHYFQLAPLDKFLQREGAKHMTRPYVIDMVRHVLKGEKDRLNIKGKFRNVWWVPSDAIMPAPEIDPPEVKKDPI